MPADERASARWPLDLFWLLFLLALALLPPVNELHKQEILALIGAFQLLESRFIAAVGKRGPSYTVLVKIGLATLLLGHTAPTGADVIEVSVNSSYYPIYYLPVMTAAMYFGPWSTLLWTLLTSAAYLSSFLPVVHPLRMHEIELAPGWEAELILRVIFFFLVGMIVNRFVMEYRAQVRRYQALAEDLTVTNENLKKAQAEARRAERLAALGQLSAGLAHEIRNPLGVIKGSAEILNQKVPASETLAKELSGYIYTEVNRLSALVGRFLDFARPSHLELRPLELPGLLDRVLKSVSEQVDIKNVRIHRDYAANVPAVLADEQLCDQVFTNLITNACEAMGEQGGELNIRVHPRSSDTRQDVIVEIQDTGPGIPLEIKEQIFNPFFTTKKTGVGLGLAIVSKIIDAHGGTVQVQSEPGQGACFQVRLPQAETMHPAEKKELQIQ